MEKQKISVKMDLPYKEAVAYLEDLLKCLKSGTIVVESGGDHVTMKPGKNVAIEVEAKVSKGKQKFELEIEWPDGKAVDLTISDKKPAPAKPAKTKAKKAEKPKKAATKKAKPKEAAPAPAAKKKPAVKKAVKGKGNAKKAAPKTAKKTAKKATKKSPAKPKTKKA